MTTNVPTPTFGADGFVLPTEQAILEGVQLDYNVAFGVTLNPGLSTPQGQLASSTAAIIGDANVVFLYIANQVDPAFSEGRMQDAIARIYFLERIPSAPTVVEAQCSGLTGVVIPIGALARATDGNLYVATERGTIPAGGTVTLPFACTVEGVIPCPAGTLTEIAQALNGWESITNSDAGALGRDVETRANFEERRRLSTAINSTGQLPAILGAVLAVEDVLDAFVTENPTSSPLRFGGTWLSPHSLYVCALGGEAQDIAEAIWSRKAPGCAYNGDTVVTVEDPSPSYSAPAPTYEVRFQRPDIIDFTVLVVIRDNVQIPEDALDQIQDAIIAAFAGSDGGSRAKIGNVIFASRYYGPVTALGDWAQVVKITLGRTGSVASIVGSITGQVLTVSQVTSGQIAVGNLVAGSGIECTTITSFVSGTLGGSGVYLVAESQVSGTGIVMNVTELLDLVELDIDEAPSVSADGICLQLVDIVL